MMWSRHYVVFRCMGVDKTLTLLLDPESAPYSGPHSGPHSGPYPGPVNFFGERKI